jgi:predicted deacylase
MKKLHFIVLLFIIIILWYYFYKWAIDIDVYTINSFNPGPTIFMIAGTHGNEPAGKNSLNKLIESNIKLKRGNLIIIPEANKSGGLLYLRWLVHNWINPDLNRNYTDNGKDEISKNIIEYVKKSDFIVDFHEGWGYRIKNPKSMGSTLSFTTEKSKFLANNIIKEINKTIKEDDKKFTLNKNEDNLLTLRNYAKRKNKDYILVETTGQSNIQKMETRLEQNEIIINSILLDFDMI